MSATDLGPLDWRIAITDQGGRPTPEFQRRWNTQRNNNELIGAATGIGPPVGSPLADGAEYVDISTDPAVLYVGYNGSWVQVGVVDFTDLSDVPSSYTGQSNKFVVVNVGETALAFRVIASTDVPFLLIGFGLGTGATGTSVATPALAPRVGSVTKCKFVTQVSDGATDLTFRIKKNGVNIFSVDPTVTHGTSAGTVSTFTTLTSSPLSIAVDDVFTLDITSGTATWKGTIQLE